RPATWATNATQHPGQVVLDARQKCRTASQLQKIRTEEHLDRDRTEKGMRTALEHVACLQDELHIQDLESQCAIAAPLLR
ncbi:hypothetical protein EI94DRAFT_1461291, partial [Lactarius quietus]